MSKEKDDLIDALVRLALALNDSTTEGCSNADVDVSFDDTLRQLRSWVDIESSLKFSTLRIAREMRAGRYGMALKQINTMLEDEGKEKDTVIRPMTRSDLLAKRSSIYLRLGFVSLYENGVRAQAINCPKNYTPF
jgi:hypothetical protein